MSLAGKQSTKFYVTTGAGADKIDPTRKTDLETLVGADAAKGNDILINDNILGPVIMNIQRMQDDLDELRRFVVDATEIRTIVSPLPTTNGGTGLAGGNDFYPVRYARVVLNTATMNDLDHEHGSQTGQVLVAAPGAGLWVNPIDIRVDIDYAAAQTNTRADLNISWDLGGKVPAVGTNVLYWARRFGVGITADTQWAFRKMDGKQIFDGDLVGSRINKALVAVGTYNQPFTPNCFTSCTFHVAYQILPQ